MKQLRFCILMGILAAFSMPLAASSVNAEKAAVKEFLKSEVVKKFHANAYGYAVFPGIAKGGIGIGGAHGKGGVYRAGKRTGNTTMSQISIGLQLGGQAFRQIIYFEDKRAYGEFTSGSFEFGAQAEAIAITASVGAQAGTDGASTSANQKQKGSRYHKGMIVFTMGKGGLMYQATIGGQAYEFSPTN